MRRNARALLAPLALAGAISLTGGGAAPASRFDAPAADVNAVRSDATRFGLQLYDPGGLGDVTLASGAAAQVERTFGVSPHRYLDAAGGESYANVNARPYRRTSASTACSASRTRSSSSTREAAASPASRRRRGQCVAEHRMIGEGRTDDVIRALRRFEATRNLPNVPVQVYWTDPGRPTSRPSSQG
jgi:hypothetical protein